MAKPFLSLEEKLDHLRRYFDFTEEELKDIARFYSLDESSLNTQGVQRLLAESKRLCDEFNAAKRPKNSTWYYLRRLFPRCPNVVVVRRGLSVVIGTVFLGKTAFVNVNTTFGTMVDVTVGHNAQFGPNTYIGVERPCKIVIDPYAWICSGVRILSSANIGRCSVVAAGAVVNEDVSPSALYVGRPAAYKKDIEKGDFLTPLDLSFYTDEEEAFVRKRMKEEGSGRPKALFTRVIKGKLFSTLNLPVSFHYLRTHALCRKLDDPSLTSEEREKVIDALFPIHGKNVRIGKNFFIDLVGTVALGDNVSIGDNVSLGGLVRLGDNVTIEDNSTLFASNHPLDYSMRGVGFYKGLGLSIPVQYFPVTVNPGVHIGKRCVAAPKTVVDADLPDDSLVLGKGKVIPLSK